MPKAAPKKFIRHFQKLEMILKWNKQNTVKLPQKYHFYFYFNFLGAALGISICLTTLNTWTMFLHLYVLEYISSLVILLKKKRIYQRCVFVLLAVPVIMQCFANLQSPHHFIVFHFSCDKDYHKQKLRFLYLLGQIVTWHYNPYPSDLKMLHLYLLGQNCLHLTF